MKAVGAIVSHIAQTMQMSVYSIQKRHRENPGDAKDRPRSRRRRAATTVAGTFHEDAYYTQYYTLSSTIKISHDIEYVFVKFLQNWKEMDKPGVLWLFSKVPNLRVQKFSLFVHLAL